MGWRRSTWMLRVLQKAATGWIGPIEALTFLRARCGAEAGAFRLRGAKFVDADRAFCDLALNVIIRNEYLRHGLTLQPNDAVVDIGANRGLFVALARSLTSGPIHAWEPSPENVAAIRRMAQANGFEDVTVHEKAVGARSGRARLFLADAASRHTITGQDLLTGAGLEQTIDVEVVGLDEALASFDSVGLLKVDCEGAEFEMFEACSDATLAKVRQVVMEYHAPRGDARIDGLQRRLEQAGFVAHREPSRSAPLGLIYASRVA